MINKDYKKKIGFQGDFGANQHLACRTYFPNAQYQPYDRFEDLFTAIESKELDLALLPLENSYSGRVAEIHNLLYKTNLYIVGEYCLDINHNLAVLPGAKMTDITEIISHPQALMQCSNNIKSLKVKTSASLNTAIAAKLIKDRQDKSYATLCSDLAAKINGLEVLKEGFQDNSNNKTIFITIAREVDFLPVSATQKITTLLFSVRNIPSAIYKALGGFATNNINIIKLESYIPGGISAKAEFFISFEGSPDDIGVKNALDELGFFSKKIKLLGIYNCFVKRYKKTSIRN
jgi:prephenate dehydratase